MTDVVLVAHGKLAHEMKNSGEMIFGKLDNFHTLEFLIGEGLENVVQKIDGIVSEIDSDSILIITDIFSGTPYNASCSYAMTHLDKNIRVLSGMSLPIVLEVAAMAGCNNAEDIVKHILEVGKDTIRTFDLSAIEEEDEL